MKPNPETYNPDPEYLQGLLQQAYPDLPLFKRYEAAASALNISVKSIQAYIDARGVASTRDIPYTAQFALECLARGEELCPVCHALLKNLEG
jgi:hypothetical protein